MTLKYRRDFPEIKSLNYIAPIQALPKLRAAKADDVLYHWGGYISESSRANILIVKNNKLITPKTFILDGITRQNILKIAKNHFEIEVRGVRLEEVWEADEVMMAGSTRRVTRIGQIDDRRYEKHDATQKIYDLLVELERE